MQRKFNIAIVGATGLVGRTALNILEARCFPFKRIYLMGSKSSVGEAIPFQRENILVESLADFDFKKAEIALFTAGEAVSEHYAPIAAKKGCLVIDNTSQFRGEDDIPLVVPEVNPEALADYKKRFIIANPNCSTIQMVVALKPVYDAVGITRINVVTFQSVSGAGKAALDELIHQTGQFLNGLTTKKPKVFPQPIAFNLIPHIGDFESNGYTQEEMKLVWETRKILRDPSIQVNPTAVRVPVFYSHSEAIHIETKRKVSVAEVKKILKRSPGVILMDKTAGGKPIYPTPIKSHSFTEDKVLIGRLRKDISHPQGLSLWVVADNIRKGAALNAVQIAELMIKKYL